MKIQLLVLNVLILTKINQTYAELVPTLTKPILFVFVTIINIMTLLQVHVLTVIKNVLSAKQEMQINVQNV